MENEDFQIKESHLQIDEETTEGQPPVWSVRIECGNEQIANEFKNKILEHSKLAFEINKEPQDEYAKRRMDEASKMMKATTNRSSTYEFNKGQFLAFREIVNPQYRKEAIPK